jgi:tRNA pseudouridine55 synthase
MEELLLIDKPKGITSFDVIRKLRKKLDIWKMGHAGTLDPMATGLMLIGVGKGTKKLSTLIGLSKVYEAEITLGVRTTTGDIEGEVIEQQLCNVSEPHVAMVIERMVGVHELSVPVYSAIKRNGKPLYEYARRGMDVEVPIKKMEVYETTFVSYEPQIIKVIFKVSSGTYIRSLAEEIGKRLGTVGTLSALRRTSIGDYHIDKAETI